ncbi:MAG TPA: 2-C-methyl-D-erythritol 4-phosphate cytidylyltransferase [Tepidisphaeraceae bacterium]|nr:2-C-methyl-D-erythritol 4-phosphate cytidylyltransferase [Tepidisphaeraceae bacterium]
MAVFSVIIVTVPPAGQGAEGGGPFVKIDGRESLLRSVELFLNRDNIKQIQIVFTPEAIEEAKRKHGGHFSFSGVKVVSGGPKWVDQLAAAAEKISDESTHVIVHDAARPAVAYSDIDELMNEAEKHPVVSLATPMRSTLVEVDEGGGAMAFHQASRFMSVVTPQAFKKDRFIELAKSRTEPHASEVTLLKGSALNLRVGSGADASVIKAMINMLPKPKMKGPMTPFEEAQW